MSQSSRNPADEYRERRDDRRRSARLLRRREAALSYSRLGIFLIGAGLLWPVVMSRTLDWFWLGIPLAAFLGAVLLHDRIIRVRERLERAQRFYERGLERLADDWAGRGNPGDDFLDPQHPYTGDLDMFGRGSLFELLCRARTHSGERTLADWLSRPATAGEVVRRQAAVGELRDRLGLREDLAVLGEEVRGDDDPDALTAWASSPPVLTARWPVWVCGVLALLNVVAIGLWFTQPWGSVALMIAIVVSGGFAAIFRSRVHRVFGVVSHPEHVLELLAGVLGRLEAESFSSPLLRSLRAELDIEGVPPSRRISQLARLVEINDSRRNLVFQPLAATFLLGTQLAFAMERWRERSGRAVERWLAAVGELEALSSLASFAYENPHDIFPEIVEDGPCFDGERLGHPLLPRSRSVSNDLRLDGSLQLLLVSGSNMSGKSTLLRTVGVNTVLALAGGTVRAARLRISRLSIGACMRVQDSLQEGTSQFYAEITRLRGIVDLTDGSDAVLFLLDEVLHGTNSHDRKIGASALVRNLVTRGALGLVTTHDLALAEIADALAPRARNVHFEDHLEEGRIVFDYVMRPGIVRKSNALELMRAVGLEV